MQFSLFLGKISCIIVAGGYIPYSIRDRVCTIDVLTKELRVRTKQVPNLHAEICSSSMVIHDETILMCGGLTNAQKCFQLDHGTWKMHSTLNSERVANSIVATQKATFIFGGRWSRKTYEYLPKGSTTWVLGETEIPGMGFASGCAIAVNSEQEIWLIGGEGGGPSNRIYSFNVNNHTFHEMATQLNIGRIGHRCAFIPNTNKIMVTGGCHSGFMSSTEILNSEDGSITMASPMNSKRSGHGMGVITINGEDQLAVFGGFIGHIWLESVEVYNIRTEKWDLTDIRLKKPKDCFGFLTVKLSDAISALSVDH